MNYSKTIMDNYNIDNILKIELINIGNVNQTYKIYTDKQNYIFQKINREAFKEPYKLMNNIENITKFLKSQTIDETLNIIYTKNNKSLLEIFENDTLEYYRLYNCIENKTSYDKITDIKLAYLIGKAFGNFEKLLIDYPKEELEETIPNFHNTVKIYNDFIKNIETSKNKRILEIQEEIKFINDNIDIIYSISNLLNKNLLPKHIIHGDTKKNNVMVNIEESTFTVIDFDTISYNTILYDYGDGIRSIANKNCLDLALFKSYTDGYLSEMRLCLTNIEIQNMGLSIALITLELCIRYLDDYINNDKYFNTSYDNQNLDRARECVQLFKDIMTKMPVINKYIIEKYENLN